MVEGAPDKELYVTRQKFNADFVFFKKERHLILPASMFNKKCAPSAIGGKKYEKDPCKKMKIWKKVRKKKYEKKIRGKK